MTTELDNDTLEWAAQWLEGSLNGEPNERVREFGKNMAMTLRAAKLPGSRTSVAAPPPDESWMNAVELWAHELAQTDPTATKVAIIVNQMLAKVASARHRAPSPVAATVDKCEHGVLWSMECLSCGPSEYVAAPPVIKHRWRCACGWCGLPSEMMVSNDLRSCPQCGGSGGLILDAAARVDAETDINAMWEALKAECCKNPAEAKLAVFVSEQKFKKALARFAAPSDSSIRAANDLCFPKPCVHCNQIDCECSDFDVSPDMGAKG